MLSPSTSRAWARAKRTSIRVALKYSREPPGDDVCSVRPVRIAGGGGRGGPAYDAGGQVRGRGEPAGRSPGVEQYDLQPAAVRTRPRQQFQAALERADVADDDHPRPAPDPAPPVEADVQPHPGSRRCRAADRV
ncbi:hypothetical protein GCM10020254_07670 [Streptomyces goshikiensis]